MKQHMQLTVDIMGIDGKRQIDKNVKVLNIANGSGSIMINKKMNIGSKHVLRIKSKKEFTEVRCSVVWSKRSEAILLLHSM